MKYEFLPKMTNLTKPMITPTLRIFGNDRVAYEMRDITAYRVFFHPKYFFFIRRKRNVDVVG